MELIWLLFGSSSLLGWWAYKNRPTTGASANLPQNIPTPQEKPTPPAPMRSQDVDTLARTIWGEARGEGYSGMQAVANVIMNRYRAALNSPGKARQYGSSVTEICRKPYQFSAWLSNDPNRGMMLSVNESNTQFRIALDIAEKAVAWRLPDITGGADHYHTNGVKPAWSVGLRPIASIGSHKFFDLA